MGNWRYSMTFRVLKEMMYIFYVPGLNTVTRDFKLKVEYRTPFIKICFSVIWSTHIHTVNQGTRQPPVTYCKPLQTMKFPSPTPRLHRSDRSLLRGGNTFLEPEAGFFSAEKDPGVIRLENKPPSTNGPIGGLLLSILQIPDERNDQIENISIANQ